MKIQTLSVEQLLIIALLGIVLIGFLVCLYESREDYEVFALVKSTRRNKNDVPEWECLKWSKSSKKMCDEALVLNEACYNNNVSYIVVPLYFSVLPFQLRVNIEKQTQKEYWKRLRLIGKCKASMSCIF